MKTRSLKILTVVFCVILMGLTLVSCAEENELNRKDEYAMIEAVDNLNAAAEKDEYILVSFPGLGIEPIVLNKLAFSLGNLGVYWYGILITVGIVLAFVYAYIKSKREGISTNDLLDMGIWGVVCAVVGARLYYVLTSLGSFKGRFFDIFKIWEGGIAIYGAIIGGAIAIAVVCKLKKIKVLKAYDAVAPAVMIGQIIGRWGNFVNGEAYGYEIAEGSIFYGLRMGIYPHVADGITAAETRLAYVHPTFLYESVWNLLGFIIINIFYSRKKKFDGQIFFMYMAWYGFGRTFIELLRTDSLYLFGTIRISALVGCLCFFCGVAMLIYCYLQGKKARLADEEYESAYPLFGTKFAKEKAADEKEEINNDTEDKNDEVD